MKQKFLLSAVLLGALALGSCVDDTESASVTAVRNAKAEQLKSIANLNNAQAEAEKVAANAAATLAAAQAKAAEANAAIAQAEAARIQKETELIELQKKAQELANEAAALANEAAKIANDLAKAKAEAWEAEEVIRLEQLAEQLKQQQLYNEQQRIANEQAQARLESQLAQLAVEKARAEATLAQIANDMKEEALRHQAEMERLQASLLAAQEQLRLKEKELLETAEEEEKEALRKEAEELRHIVDVYTMTFQNLTNAQSTLNSYKTDLALAEEDLVNAQASKEAEIEGNNRWIAIYEAQIEEYKKYALYLESEDVKELQDALSVLAAQNNRLAEEYNIINNAFNNIDVDTQETDEMDYEIQNDPFYQFAVYGWWVVETENGYDTKSAPYFLQDVRGYNNGDGIIWPENKKYTYSDEYGDVVRYWGLGDSAYIEFNGPAADLRRAELSVSYRKESLENSIKGEKEYKENQMIANFLKGTATQAMYDNFNGPEYYVYENGSWEVTYDSEGYPIYEWVVYSYGLGSYTMVFPTTSLKGFDADNLDMPILEAIDYDKSAKVKNVNDSVAWLEKNWKDSIGTKGEAAARAAYDNFYNRYVEYKTVESLVESNESYIAYLEDQLATLEQAWDYIVNFDTYKAELQKKLDARNEKNVELFAEKVEVWKESCAAYSAYREVNDEYYLVDGILYGMGDATGAQFIDDEIARREQMIKDLEKSNEDLNLIESKEGMIEYWKQQIEMQEARVKLAQIEFDAAKADYDKAFAE